MADLQALSQAVIEGNLEAAKKLTNEAIAAGTDPQTIFRQALVPAMTPSARRCRPRNTTSPRSSSRPAR